ncbi:hypothetical protein [Nonomuraea sp. 10N515B]|uniref:hypothetical protein n=1 Tax=Nonomuraea sp. 10N515B TaxID=3457422 RepID=UPI003FCE7466
MTDERDHHRRRLFPYLIRPDVVYLPVRDMDALPYALVWRAETENALIHALAHTTRDLGPQRLHR